MANFKAIGKENLSIIENTDTSDHYTILGSNLRVYNVLPKNDVNFTNNPTSHVWGSLMGVYSDAIADTFNVDYVEGGFKNTAIEDLYDAYYNDGGILISIDNDVYRKSLVGRDGAMRIPLTGGTGGLSGLTAMTLYTAFFDQPDALKVERTSDCGGAIFDCKRFETLPDATIRTGIASAAEPGNTNGMYKSCISYIFADELSFTTGSTTGNSFTTGHQSRRPYGTGNKYRPDFINDRAVGVMNCCSGNIFLFNKDIVDSFNYSVAVSGTTGTTGYAYSDSDIYVNTQDFDSSKEVQVKIIANPQEFTITGSRNPSKEQAIIDGLDCGDKSYITGICMTDNTGTPVAFGVLDESVLKTKEGFAAFNLIAALDGGILDNPFDNGIVYTT